MNSNIQSIIKKSYESLPEDIKQAITNTDLGGKFLAIANRHNLHIDQSGSLQNETLLVMLGLEPTKDYVGNLEKELEITEGEARSIAEDINKEIFNSIRASLREIQNGEEIEENQENVPSTLPTDISSIEKAGNFVVEKRPESSSPIHKDNNLNRETVLKDIEDAKNITGKNGVSFVEHLLGNKIENREQIKEVKKQAIDPYREAI